jgi:hypothetical protein
MRENSRVGQRFEASLGARQVVAIVAASLVMVGGAFVLGASYGGRAARATVAESASRDPLAPLDEPLTAAPRDDASLRAHEALVGAHAEALPVPAAKPAAANTNTNATANSNATSNANAPANATQTSTLTATAAQPLSPSLSPLGGEREMKGSSRALPARRDPKPNLHAAHRASYTIQVASTAHRAEADRIAKRFARRSPRVVAADVPGKGRVWRVQVGSYATRDAAARGLASLGGTGFVTASR